MNSSLAEQSRNYRQFSVRLLLVIVGLGFWFLTQFLIGQRAVPEANFEQAGSVLTRCDAGLMATDSLNSFLRTHRTVASALLISSSAVIDLLGVFLLFQAIFGPSFRPFLGLLILFALRQFSQMLCILPPPVGMIWESPGFPSLLVTYSVGNDFFFSGHTGIAVFGAIEIGRLKGRNGILWGIAIAVFEVTSVLVLRAHYTMDVLTGILAALCATQAADYFAPGVDQRIAGPGGRVSPIPAVSSNASC